MFASHSKNKASAQGAQNVHEALDPKIDSLTKSVESLKTDKSLLTTENEALQRQLTSAKFEIRTLTAQGIKDREETKTALEKATSLTTEIVGLKQQIAEAKTNKSLTDKQIAELEAKLEVLEKIRRKVFIERSTKVYLREMRTLSVSGGKPEIQAIAIVLNVNINVWSMISLNSFLTKEIDYCTQVATASNSINILLSQTGTHIHFEALSPSYEPTIGVISTADIIHVPKDGNNLFYACLKSHPYNASAKISDDYLPLSTYALRLETCEVIRNRNEILKPFFEDIMTEIMCNKGVNIEESISRLQSNKYVIEHIKLIASEHYSEIFTSPIEMTSGLDKRVSDSSLGDTDDFRLLGSINEVLDFNEHDKEVETFLSIVGRKYIDLVEFNQSVPFLGGPIELQAMVELYGWQIKFKAYSDDDLSGKEKYSKIFERSKSTSNGIANIALIHAGKSKASYLILDVSGKPLDIGGLPVDLNVGGYSTIFEACANAFIGLTSKELQIATHEYLIRQSSSAINLQLTKNTRSDGITSYFIDHIFINKSHEKWDDYDLIPASKLKEDANKLRVMRKTLLKISNAIMERVNAEIENEMSAWQSPIHSMLQANTAYFGVFKYLKSQELNMACDVDRENIQKLLLLMLGLTSSALSFYTGLAGDLWATSTAKVYKDTSIAATTGTIISSAIYVIGSYFTEKNRAAVVSSTQDSLVSNLPLDRIQELTLISKNGIDGRYKKYTKPSKEINPDYLYLLWRSPNCIGISFILKDDKMNIFSITKPSHISLKDKVQNNFVVPWLVVMAIIQISLTQVSNDDVNAQVKACESRNANVTTGGSLITDCLTNYQSPIAAKANLAICLVTLVSQILDACIDKRRTCEREIHDALLAISLTYSGNKGKLPSAISGLLQSFAVDGVLSDYLTSVPQMVNIERSMFKVRNDLKEFNSALKAHIDLLLQSGFSAAEYETLQIQVNELLDKISPLKIGALYANKDDLKNTLGSLSIMQGVEARLSLHADVQATKAGKKALHFTPLKALRSSAEYLGGVLKFSAGVQGTKLKM